MQAKLFVSDQAEGAVNAVVEDERPERPGRETDSPAVMIDGEHRNSPALIVAEIIFRADVKGKNELFQRIILPVESGARADPRVVCEGGKRGSGWLV